MSERDEILRVLAEELSDEWGHLKPIDALCAYDGLIALFAKRPWIANALLPDGLVVGEWRIYADGRRLLAPSGPDPAKGE